AGDGLDSADRLLTGGDAPSEPTFAVAYLPGTELVVDDAPKTMQPGEVYRSWAERIGRMTIDTPGL
ncbi:MAG: hypothetical protein EA383_00785, partial [Spirochaetaceae bacterium]